MNNKLHNNKLSSFPIVYNLRENVVAWNPHRDSDYYPCRVCGWGGGAKNLKKTNKNIEKPKIPKNTLNIPKNNICIYLCFV